MISNERLTPVPSIPAGQHKHKRTRDMDNYISDFFPEPPLTDCKRENNIGEHAISAKEERYIRNDKSHVKYVSL